MAALTNRLVPLTASVSCVVFLPNSLQPPYEFEPAAVRGMRFGYAVRHHQALPGGNGEGHKADGLLGASYTGCFTTLRHNCRR